MTVQESTVCSLIQTFPVLLILAQNRNKCVKTPLIYKPPTPTPSPEYYEALDALFHNLFDHGHDEHGYHGYDNPHHGCGHSPYDYGKKWPMGNQNHYGSPCHSYGYPQVSGHGFGAYGYGSGGYGSGGYGSGGYGSGGYGNHGYPSYGYKKVNIYNTSGINHGYKGNYAPNQVYNLNHKYKVIVRKNKIAPHKRRSQKLTGFFSNQQRDRDDRRYGFPYGFVQNFLPNHRRDRVTVPETPTYMYPNNQQYYQNNQEYTNYEDRYNNRESRYPVRYPDYANYEEKRPVIYDSENQNDNYQEFTTKPSKVIFPGREEPVNSNPEPLPPLTHVTDYKTETPPFKPSPSLSPVPSKTELPPFRPETHPKPLPATDPPPRPTETKTDLPPLRPVTEPTPLSPIDPSPRPMEVKTDLPPANSSVESKGLPPLTPVPPSESRQNYGSQGTFQPTCETVDGGLGSCVTVFACEPYLALLQQSRSNPALVQVLRKAHCGFEGNDPKVCCPRPGIPTAPPPPPPPPTTTVAPVTEAEGKAAPSEDFVEGLPEPPVCGVSNASLSRVVGGVDAHLGDFPWMALLGYMNRRTQATKWLCGGALVTARHVLTAAHCIHGHETDLHVVRLGELDLAKEDDGATPLDVYIRTKIKHEAYSANAYTNDIGILILERPVQFTDLIKPICIPRDDELRARSYENYNPIIAGWGDIEFRGPAATHLQVLQLPVVSNDFCSQAYSAYKAQVIDQRVLCAGYKKGGKDACQGDSGGPLMQPIWNSQTFTTYFYQIGVVSYGKKCAEAGFPGVYTRVTHFVPWIEKTILTGA